MAKVREGTAYGFGQMEEGAMTLLVRKLISRLVRGGEAG